jgi:hypothetical protein
MRDRLAAATPRLRDTAYAAGETGSAPSQSTAWYSEWLSLNIHLHSLMLDGVYQTSATADTNTDKADNPPTFIEALFGNLLFLLILLHTCIRT